MYVLTALLTALVGARPNVAISVGASLFFALAVVAGAAVFAAVGALASELMPTRSRAAGVSAAVFGAAFMLRALGDCHHQRPLAGLRSARSAGWSSCTR